MFAAIDAEGYGDAQFQAFVAGSRPREGVPTLSALLDSAEVPPRPGSDDRDVAALHSILARSGGVPNSRPLTSFRATSAFGLRYHPILGGYRRHAGVDLAALAGTPIRATADGVVRAADWHGGYGLLAELGHSGGYSTRYGHMSRLNVRVGQIVHKGDTIGYVGSTGRSTGPHLHYEVLRDGRAVDPMSFMGR